jgi:hypothetical protein
MTTEHASKKARDGVDRDAFAVCEEHAVTPEAYREYLGHVDAAHRLWPWRVVAAEINQQHTEQ